MFSQIEATITNRSGQKCYDSSHDSYLTRTPESPIPYMRSNTNWIRELLQTFLLKKAYVLSTLKVKKVLRHVTEIMFLFTQNIVIELFSTVEMV